MKSEAVLAGDRAEPEGTVLRSAPWRFMAGIWSLLALLAGLALTVSVYHYQQRTQAAAQIVTDNELGNETFAILQTKLHAGESLLRAVQTLFLASDEVSADEFGTFYDNLRAREQFPSLQALAFSRLESGPDGPRYVTSWVRPALGNETLDALDLSLQPANFATVVAARDTDQIAMSAPFELVQLRSRPNHSDGVTLRLPIFSPGPSPQTLAQRQERERGTIAVSFGVHGLISQAIEDHVSPNLRLRVSDVTDPTKPVLLFDDRPDSPLDADNVRFERVLKFGGRSWRLTLRLRDSAAPALAWNQSVLPAGLLASLLLALLVFSVVGTRQRALELGWKMSRRYRESEERFRALNDLLPALVLMVDRDSGRITYANMASRERLGVNVAEGTLADLFEDETLHLQLLNTELGDSRRADAILHDSAGGHFWASIAISQVVLNGNSKLLVVANDVSEQRQLTELLGHQASHDSLTELFNRGEFERRLQLALLNMTPGASPALLMYVDLDQFKLINDISGHLAGDQLLAQLALVMRKQVGESDLLARLGGDEFGLLVVKVADQEDARRIADRVRCSIDGYVFIWEQRSYTISASIGAVLIDHAGMQVKDVLTQADTACYIAKELGRNRVHFYAQDDGQTARRRSEMEWAHRLRGAIDEQRLVLVCQEIWPLPLVSATDDQIGVEMLLRFRDDSGELVVPGVFMPAAERFGLMPAIDRWVIQTTLAHFDRLHRVGNRLHTAAINLSGASLDDSSLAEQIVEWLQLYKVEPSRVCFEVTETVAVRNLSQVVRFMERLRAVGCSVSLDDFGAGMSSFTYLKNLPVDVIKIDGSFIRDMQTDPVSYLMVKAVTDIGHRLGLEVVAEWVSTPETVQALAALGVDRVQGFSLHQPELALFQRD